MPALPAAEFKANDYGAKPGDKGNNTEAIQKAIDAAAEAGGGTVVLGRRGSTRAARSS